MSKSRKIGSAAHLPSIGKLLEIRISNLQPLSDIWRGAVVHGVLDGSR